MGIASAASSSPTRIWTKTVDSSGSTSSESALITLELGLVAVERLDIREATERVKGVVPYRQSIVDSSTSAARANPKCGMGLKELLPSQE